MAVTINGTTGIAGVDGSASTPAVQGTDTNTGIFFPAADTIAFGEGGAEVARFNSSGNFGIGTTTVNARLEVKDGTVRIYHANASNGAGYSLDFSTDGGGTDTTNAYIAASQVGNNARTANLIFATSNAAAPAERVRIDSNGNFFVNKTTTTTTGAGGYLAASGEFTATVLDGAVAVFRRDTTDGIIVYFSQDGTSEGTISVSGTTVSYNGGHLSRWAQMLTKPDLLKGTVMSNLDEMNVYTKDGEPIANEQLNKVKVSDVEGDVNVAGVFVNWEYDEDHQVDEINMAMTGDMIIRIAQGVVVQKGDLLMSAGDGTAKPQGDDIVRSKTVAKVTSNHVTCTYADGSYCVPCVLMAC